LRAAAAPVFPQGGLGPVAAQRGGGARGLPAPGAAPEGAAAHRAARPAAAARLGAARRGLRGHLRPAGVPPLQPRADPGVHGAVRHGRQRAGLRAGRLGEDRLRGVRAAAPAQDPARRPVRVRGAEGGDRGAAPPRLGRQVRQLIGARAGPQRGAAHGRDGRRPAA
ncbi:unnamed protein product, partial [Heterosigma akashiwo]